MSLFLSAINNFKDVIITLHGIAEVFENLTENHLVKLSANNEWAYALDSILYKLVFLYVDFGSTYFYSDIIKMKTPP